MDGGYIDYKRLYKIHIGDDTSLPRQNKLNYRRLYLHPKGVIKGIIYDQTISK